ncbi:hypothetical protein DSECCO2_446470 [anaerobic digester metagenome]
MHCAENIFGIDAKCCAVCFLIFIEWTCVRIGLRQVVELAQIQPFRILMKIIAVRNNLRHNQFSGRMKSNFFIQFIAPVCLMVAVSITIGPAVTDSIVHQFLRATQLNQRFAESIGTNTLRKHAAERFIKAIGCCNIDHTC